jgi:hypothetical protein
MRMSTPTARPPQIPPDPSMPPHDVARPDVPVSVKAQLLATEHWSLLASRSTTQNEVLTRISMFLTLVSAALVSLALVGQATGFSETFSVFAVAVLGVVSLVGVLTELRVMNVAFEDLMYVVAMNRIRGEYAEIDPDVAHVFMASAHDDQAGSAATYYFFGKRSNLSQVAASSMTFIEAINGAMIGLLVASVAQVLAASVTVSVVIGIVCGIAYFAVTSARGARRYFAIWKNHTSRYPTPTTGDV